jgi:hypothetical protein
MMSRRRKEPRKGLQLPRNCKIQAADSIVSIPWNEVRAGYWNHDASAASRGWQAPDAGLGRGNDPYDQANAAT